MEVAQALLAAGADVNAQKHDGETALHRAAGNGRVGLARALLAAGADPDAKDEDGCTALMYAARRNANPEVVKVLLAAGAQPNAINKYGKTALTLAREHGNTAAIEVLEKGWDKSGPNAGLQDS